MPISHITHKEKKLTWTLYVHEVRVRSRYESLELVLRALRLDGRVKKVDGERLRTGQTFSVHLLLHTPSETGSGDSF
jgi:hypothetical protein